MRTTRLLAVPVLLSPALAAALLVLSRPTAAQAKNDRNCPEAEYYVLLRAKQLNCDSPHPKSCKPDTSCAELPSIMSRILGCINAREELSSRCFNGKDPGHARQIESLNQAIGKCLQISLEKKCGDQDQSCKE